MPSTETNWYSIRQTGTIEFSNSKMVISSNGTFWYTVTISNGTSQFVTIHWGPTATMAITNGWVRLSGTSTTKSPNIGLDTDGNVVLFQILANCNPNLLIL
jgi:hypothetical protein